MSVEDWVHEPRITEAQRDALPTTVDRRIIFNVTAGQYEILISGTGWIALRDYATS